MKQGVSPEVRQQVIGLRRRMSLREVAQATQLSIGTVKTIISRSGAFRDNPTHRALFCLPPIQDLSAADLIAQDLPPQQTITGDRDIDALLWLRSVISTGQPGPIAAAMEAAKKIRTPLKHIEERYRDYLRAHHPGNMFAALSSFDLGDLETLATRSITKAQRAAEARARFGDQLFSLTDAEVFCVSTLSRLATPLCGGFDVAEVAECFKDQPDLLPHTLSDCLGELDYWNQLYWLRAAADPSGIGDPAPEAHARDTFVFELLAEIRPRNKDESKAVFRHLVEQDRGDLRDLDRVIENLLS